MMKVSMNRKVARACAASLLTILSVAPAARARVNGTEIDRCADFVDKASEAAGRRLASRDRSFFSGTGLLAVEMQMAAAAPARADTADVIRREIDVKLAQVSPEGAVASCALDPRRALREVRDLLRMQEVLGKDKPGAMYGR